MDYKNIFSKLEENKSVFHGHLKNCSPEEYLWKNSPNKWCLLEVLCHLYDEEREDFRTRVSCSLEKPHQAPPPIDPVDWVTSRKYLDENFNEKLELFLLEREKSVEWLRSLDQPEWENGYDHPEFGKRTARQYLINWLAHDYMHLRQILGLKFGYLKFTSGENLNYAGNW